MLGLLVESKDKVDHALTLSKNHHGKRSKKDEILALAQFYRTLSRSSECLPESHWRRLGSSGSVPVHVGQKRTDRFDLFCPHLFLVGTVPPAFQRKISHQDRRSKTHCKRTPPQLARCSAKVRTRLSTASSWTRLTHIKREYFRRRGEKMDVLPRMARNFRN